MSSGYSASLEDSYRNPGNSGVLQREAKTAPKEPQTSNFKPQTFSTSSNSQFQIPSPFSYFYEHETAYEADPRMAAPGSRLSVCSEKNT